jgi:hypothetical protein
VSYADVVLMRHAARELRDAARRERGLLDMDAPERTFLLGVDAAAQEILKPELIVARADSWLSSEAPLFREGYLRAQVVLSTARAARGQVELVLPRLADRASVDVDLTKEEQTSQASTG